MTLGAMEFICRFNLHILPQGIVRIHHYGICNSSAKKKSAIIIKAQLPERLPSSAHTNPATVPYQAKRFPA